MTSWEDSGPGGFPSHPPHAAGSASSSHAHRTKEEVRAHRHERPTLAARNYPDTNTDKE